FGFIFFTVCHTSEELRIVLEEFFKIKQREKDVCTHLFVRYRTKNSEDDDDDDDDEVSIDEKLNIATNDET
ncbi:unnamed protein product, partial [Rotaria magnacalcarata]